MPGFEDIYYKMRSDSDCASPSRAEAETQLRSDPTDGRPNGISRYFTDVLTNMKDSGDGNGGFL